jgi:hypothetical protein
MGSTVAAKPHAALAAATVLVGLLSACSSPEAPRPSGPATGASPSCATTLGAAAWIVGGEDPFNATLARTDGCAVTEVDVQRVSAVDVAAGGVVVAAATSGTNDLIAMVKGSDLQPLASGTQPAGVTPAINSRGDVAFVALTASRRTPFELVQITASGDQTVPLRAASPLLSPEFGPAGEVAVWEESTGLESSNAASFGHVVIVAGGRPRRLRVDIGEVNGMTWSWVSDQILLTGRTGPGRVLDVESGTTTGSIPPHWRVLDTRKDGVVLVARNGRLYTWDRAADGRALESVDFPGDVYDAAWSD